MSAPSKVPYSRYLQLMCLTNVSDDTIIEGFHRRHLKPPTRAELQTIRTSLLNRMPEETKAFFTAASGSIDLFTVPDDVQEFILLMGFSDVIKNQSAFAAAKVCFDNVDLRVCMYSHIINNEPDDEINRVFKKMMKYSPHKDLIPFFKKYFCDMIYMDYVAWKEWIVDLRDINPFEYDIYRACFDSRFPFDLVRWKIHAELSSQDSDELLKQLVTFTYYKTLETMESSMDSDYEMVHSWIDKFLRTYEKHKTLGKGRMGVDSSGSVAEDAIFELKRVRTNVKNVKDLGEHAPKIAAPIVIEIPKKDAD